MSLLLLENYYFLILSNFILTTYIFVRNLIYYKYQMTWFRDFFWNKFYISKNCHKFIYHHIQPPPPQKNKSLTLDSPLFLLVYRWWIPNCSCLITSMSQRLQKKEWENHSSITILPVQVFAVKTSVKPIKHSEKKISQTKYFKSNL